MRFAPGLYQRSTPICREVPKINSLGIIPGNMGLQCESEKRIDWDNRYRFFAGLRPFYLLQYTLDGYCEFREAGGPVCQVRKGQGFLIELPSETWYGRPADVTWECLWITMGGEVVRHFVKCIHERSGGCVFTLPEGSMAELELCQLYVQLLENPFRDAIEASGPLIHFLSRLAQELGEDDQSDDAWFQRALDLLEQNLANPMFSISDLAQAVGFSYYHFIRAFQQQAGVTPRQYLIRLRMQRAYELLLLTEIPVREVMQRVGYRYAAHFRNAFHRHFGILPSKLRTRMSESSSVEQPS
ncbi:MAG: AraC family transcriptional regulator [Lentisphaerae bacterium]|nr:MAG: AraC family transcriptional regulator [Lentisphaerota bacterium]